MTASQNPSPAAGPGQLNAIRRDPAGQIVVEIAGRDEPLLNARVARCFPWSFPDRYVSIRDEKGKEALLLESLEGLPTEQRRLIESELERTVFNPQIRRVTKFKREFGVTSISAETDRGEVTFQIRSRDDIRPLSDRRALFRDADGVTYELPDVEALDPVSQKHLRAYF